jgi:phage gpG-like protein
MAEGIKVTGLGLLQKNLRSVNRELPKGLTQVHKTVAEPVAKRARSRVRSRSGRLAGTVRAQGTQRMARVSAGQRLVYGAINHYGGYPGDYPGNPFLTDTINEMSQSSLRLYDIELNKWLEGLWVDS